MALNIIHYMHDKYAYESIEMALHDKEVYRTLGCGMSGLSIAADSLSAMQVRQGLPDLQQGRQDHCRATRTSTSKAPMTI